MSFAITVAILTLLFLTSLFSFIGIPVNMVRDPLTEFIEKILITISISSASAILVLMIGYSVEHEEKTTDLKPIQTEEVKYGQVKQYVIDYNGEKIYIDELPNALNDFLPPDTTYYYQEYNDFKIFNIFYVKKSHFEFVQMSENFSE